MSFGGYFSMSCNSQLLTLSGDDGPDIVPNESNATSMGWQKQPQVHFIDDLARSSLRLARFNTANNLVDVMDGSLPHAVLLELLQFAVGAFNVTCDSDACEAHKHLLALSLDVF